MDFFVADEKEFDQAAVLVGAFDLTAKLWSGINTTAYPAEGAGSTHDRMSTIILFDAPGDFETQGVVDFGHGVLFGFDLDFVGLFVDGQAENVQVLAIAAGAPRWARATPMPQGSVLGDDVHPVAGFGFDFEPIGPLVVVGKFLIGVDFDGKFVAHDLTITLSEAFVK
jgi:hypothetical protein